MRPFSEADFGCVKARLPGSSMTDPVDLPRAYDTFMIL
jgi:hypothetical protein